MAQEYYQICETFTKRFHISSRNVTRKQTFCKPIEFFDNNWNKVIESTDKKHVEQYIKNMQEAGKNVVMQTVLK